MTEVISLSRGAPPWQPAGDARVVAEYHYYEMPLVGVIRQQGVEYLFLCLDGADRPVNFWLYVRVSPDERQALEAEQSEHDFDAILGGFEVNRPVVVALATDHHGIVEWREADNDSLRAALAELAEVLSGQARAAQELAAAI